MAIEEEIPPKAPICTADMSLTNMKTIFNDQWKKHTKTSIDPAYFFNYDHESESLVISLCSQCFQPILFHSKPDKLNPPLCDSAYTFSPMGRLILTDQLSEVAGYQAMYNRAKASYLRSRPNQMQQQQHNKTDKDQDTKLDKYLKNWI